MLGVKRWASVVLTGVILAGACTRSDEPPAPSELAEPAETTSTAVTASAGDPLPPPTDDLSSLLLPAAGVVLGWSSDDSMEGGAVLASLDGELLANVPNALALIYYGLPGPLVLRTGAAGD